MVLGIVMLAAMSHQTLSTRARPFGAMRLFAAPWIAWAWALATLAATVIWHFPQYALAAGMTEDMVKAATGWSPAAADRTTFLLAVGGVVLVVSTAITWSYGSGWRGIRLYERALKAMVWVIIIAFAVVVGRAAWAGRLPWREVLKGFLPLYVPTDPKGVATVMGAFGAAVGINMAFLFPYTLLARGWGKSHRRLSRFDLVTGMLVPFILATSLMIVAAALTIQGREDVPGKVSPVDAARMIAEAGVGETIGHVVFGLGVLGMVLSSITTHMIVCGFAASEVFGIEARGWKYRLACLIPVPGVLGVILWQQMGFYIAVWTSAVCGLMLPIAYVGFFVLQNTGAYLGRDRPEGWKAAAWNFAMVLAIAATLASVVYFLQGKFVADVVDFWNRLFSG
jgi:hypothetical protein